MMMNNIFNTLNTLLYNTILENKMSKQMINTTRNFCSPETNERIKMSLSYLALRHKENSVDFNSIYKSKKHLIPLETSPNFRINHDNIYSRIILGQSKKKDKKLCQTRTVKKVLYLKARKFPIIQPYKTMTVEKPMKPISIFRSINNKSKQVTHVNIHKHIVIKEENTKESMNHSNEKNEERKEEEKKKKFVKKLMAMPTMKLLRGGKEIRGMGRTKTHEMEKISENEFHEKANDIEYHRKIESYITKTYTDKNESSSSSHFCLNNLLNHKDFSIFGICEGNFANYHTLLASIAKEAFISHFSNLITYDLPYRFTTKDIINSVTKNDFDLIKIVFSCVLQDMKKSCRIENLEEKEVISVYCIRNRE